MHRLDIWPAAPGGKNLMDIKTVCLGMLTDGDACGYEMKKCFESSFGHFFPAGYGSIYPALATLARNGLVEYEHVPQDGKPDRKVYRITEKGREELAKGLADPNPAHRIRSEFLATLWFAHLMSDEQVATVIDNKLEEIDGFLKLIEEFVCGECVSMGPGARFVAGFGKHMATACKNYIEENSHLLSEPALRKLRAAAG